MNIPDNMSEKENEEFETLWKALFGPKEQEKKEAIKNFFNTLLVIRADHEAIDRLT